MGDFKPSKYQIDIFQAIRLLKQSLRIIGVAGSAKTTTIVSALKLLPKNKRVAFVAFNKSIVDELKRRCPNHVFVMTLHSMGFTALRRLSGQSVKIEVNAKKIHVILDYMQAALHSDAASDFQQFRSEILKLISLAKAHGIVPNQRRAVAPGLLCDAYVDWVYLIDHFNVDTDGSESFVIDQAREALKTSNADTRTIDYDDMLYQAVIYNASFWTYDAIFVDESQDLSVIQHIMVKRALKPRGYVIAVGDPRQAIYGFRGAAADSMDKMQAMFDMRDLPLSISYRCAQNVVHYAQTIEPTIEPSETAPEGEVSSWIEYEGKDFESSDMIICRNTAPVVDMAYALIRSRVSVQVLGREIGKGLTVLINRLDKRTKTVRHIHGGDGLIERLDRWLEREVDRFTGKYQDDKVAAVRDKHETIMVFINDTAVETVDELCIEIEALFKDDREGDILTLSTVHKAKGLEAPRVFVLEPDLMPSRYAFQEWQKKQEANLMYVAYTRAMKELHFIRSADMRVGPRSPASILAVTVDDGLNMEVLL